MFSYPRNLSISIDAQHGFANCKGAFNNYVDKKRGRGGQPKVHACPPRGGGALNVHVDQNIAVSKSISYHCTLEWMVKKKSNLIII